MAQHVEDYRTCSVWQLDDGRYGVRGWTTRDTGRTGPEPDVSFDPTYPTVEEARAFVDEAGF